MRREQMKLLKGAYETYFSDSRENISKQILNYVRKIIIENEDILEKMIILYREKYTLLDLYRVFDEAANEKEIYKAKKTYKKREDGFVHGVQTTSVGTIAVECSDTLEVLKYLIQAIKSRNAVAISDVYFDEISIKSALLVFFCEALQKYNLDKNLIMLIPFEECYYENFDRVIYADEEEIKVESKPSNDMFYLYLHDEDLREEFDKEILRLKNENIEFKIVEGEFENAVEEINKVFSKGAVIYTKNPEIGYKFVNWIHSKNVFVNTTLAEIEDTEDSKNNFYINKKVMYQLDKKDTKAFNERISESKKEETIENIANTQEPEIQTEEKKVEETALITREENIWYKRIIDKIKSFFKKF